MFWKQSVQQSMMGVLGQGEVSESSQVKTALKEALRGDSSGGPDP